MNGNDEVLKPTCSSTLLSGSSLLQVHTSARKSLPKDGSKGFSPSNSWMEKKQIQSALDERHELLSQEHVEKWGSLAVAKWDNRRKLAEVTRRTGKHFQTLGFEKDGTLYLYPEEALYLIETNSLELTFGGVAVSLQQGYSLLLGPNSGCSLVEYRAYSHLLRQGYKLLRFKNQKAYTAYECAIGLNQHTSSRHSHPGKNLLSSHSASKAASDGKIKSENHDGRDSSMRKQNEIKEESERRRSSQERSDSCSVTECDINVASPMKEVKSEFEQGSKTPERPLKAEEQEEHNQSTNDCIENYAVNNIKSCKISTVTNREPGISHHSSMPSTEICESRQDSHRERRVVEQPSVLQNSTVGVNSQLQSNSDYMVSLSPHQDCEESMSVEGVKTRAYDLAEKLVNLGNLLVKENSPVQKDCEKVCQTDNLYDSLQSEIVRVLGSQLDTDFLKESVASVAASAASTILSHLSSSVGSNINKSSSTEATTSGKSALDTDISKAYDEETLTCDKSSEEVITSAFKYDNVEKKTDASICFSKEGMNMENYDSETNVTQELLGRHSPEKLEGNIVSTETTSASLSTSISPKHMSNMAGSNGGNTAFGNSSTGGTDIVEDEESNNLKRSASPSKDVGESSVKRAKLVDASELEIEILDAVPEEKKVEFVNLSDESSVGFSDTAETNPLYTDGVEVIDVSDSSSSTTSSSESDSTSTGSDGLMILEVKDNKNWELERRRILETIPNMYKLTEICISPPSPDLLPTNVQPQRNSYIINRSRLLREAKDVDLRLPYPSNLMHPQPAFHLRPQGQAPQVWTPNMPLNPLAAVQAIAQLVLPMLGLPSNPFPAEQRWLSPYNDWSQRQPSWRSGPRFNVSSPRGINWQRPRPYGFRQFSPRFRQQRRGSNYNNSFSPNKPHWNDFSNQSCQRNSEFVPAQSASNEEGKTVGRHNSGQWPAWKQKCFPNQRRKMNRGSKRCRYFRPPKNYNHIHLMIEEKKKEHSTIKSVDSLCDETELSTAVKNETNSSGEDSENSVNSSLEERSSSHEDLESTDGSRSSTTDISPLLSPPQCTSFASVFKAIQVIKEMDTRTMESNTYNRLKLQYDLFSPTKPFKKACPPVPDFHLCIMKHDDDVPAPGEIQSSLHDLGDKVPILFAIVNPDSMSFMQCHNTSLPSLHLCS